MSDPTLPPNQNIQRLDRLTNWLLGLILVIPFLISFGALRDLAAHNAISYPWLYPIMIDGGLIIFKAIALRASLRGKRDNYAWAMAVLATVISVYLNIVHVPLDLPTLGLARFMAALPPLVILVSFIAVSRRIEESARNDKAIFSYQQIQEAIVDKKRQLDKTVAEKTAELDAAVQKRTAEIEQLNNQIEQMMSTKAELNVQLNDLRDEQRTQLLAKNRPVEPFNTRIEQINEAKRLAKSEAMELLLAYVASNPDATLNDIADMIGRSKSTVSNYVSELSDAGQLHKNGQGWEVISS
jgi:hypothetical protein